MAVLVLSLYVTQNALAVDQYTDLSEQVDSGDLVADGDPFEGSSATMGSSHSQSTVHAQEAKVDAEMNDAGGNDFLYPASSAMASPTQIENASSYDSSAVTTPPAYPRSERPAKRYEQAAKKKSWAKPSKKSKNKLAKKKLKKDKKIAQSKAKKKKNRYSRSET